MSTKKKKLLTLFVGIFFTAILVSMIAYSIKPLNAVSTEELKAVSVELVKNQDGGANHHLLIKFNKRLSTSDSFNQVSDEDVRSKILINGTSIYAFQAQHKISTICYYNTNGNDTLRININVASFNKVFASDEATGDIVNTEIKILNGLKVETGDVLNKDTVFTYFAMGDVFLGEGESLDQYTTNVVAVHYYDYPKHLRIYFDAPVGSYGVPGTNESVSGPARQKILINGMTVEQRGLELYMDPGSMIGSEEGNWYDSYDANGKPIWGGLYGYISSRYMIRISLASSSATYNLKKDGTDIVELLPGLRTAKGKITTNASVYKLPKENIGKMQPNGTKKEDVDFFDKAQNIVEAETVLAKMGNKSTLTLSSKSVHSPVNEVRSFTTADMSTYFSKLYMNGKSFSLISGLTAQSVENNGKYDLVFTFPENFIKFDGNDEFVISDGYIYPNGNDSRTLTKVFSNDPLSVSLSYEKSGDVVNKTNITVKYKENLTEGGEYSQITIAGSEIGEYSIDGNELKFSYNGAISDGTILMFPAGMIDGKGNAVSGTIKFIYNGATKLMVAELPSDYCLIETVNILKNQDNGVNSWVIVNFKNDVAQYASYPTKISGDEINMYSAIKLNGKSLTEAINSSEYAGMEVFWLSPRNLRVNVRSKNALLDFDNPINFTITTDFRTNLNYGLKTEYVKLLQEYSTRDNMWLEKFNENGELKNTNDNLLVTKVSPFNDEVDNMSFAITFNQDIAYGYFPHANATADFMSGILKQFYTENEIKYFVYNKLGDAIRDNIILDGKSIWERMVAEGSAVMNSRIMVHYGTVGTTTMQIFISKISKSADFIDVEKEHTLIMKAGFQVPNGGRLANDVTYKYSPVSRSWTIEGANTSNEIIIDKGEVTYPYNDGKKNCSSMTLNGAALILGVAMAAAFIFKGKEA